MEKLQPIIAQKFWILTGIAVILPFVGWWMARGALATQIDDRTKKLIHTETTIPTGQGAQNPSWSAEFEKETEKQEYRNSLSLTMLEKSQIDLRKWPLDVATVMAVCRYRGSIIKTTDIINDDNSLTAEQLKQLWNRAKNTPFEYVHEYPHEIARLWEIVDPMDDDSSDSRLDSKKKKKVMMAYKLIPQAKGAPWEGLPPTWNEMWDAQEDIWFLEDLFRAVARVNSDADNIVEAHIKKVMSVKLFGGERAVSTKTTDAPKKTGDAYIDSGGNLGNLARANTKGATATFPLEEEFIESSSRTAQTALPGATNGTNTKAPTGPPKIKRYVDEGEDFAFRTRGFVMSVIINEQRVPEFLVELTNSRWPIEICRVQQVASSGTFSINQTFSPTKSGGASFGPDNSGASDGGFIDPSSDTGESDGDADDGSTFEDPDESSGGGGSGGTGGAGVSVGAAPGSGSGDDFVDPSGSFVGQTKSAKGASNITQSALDDKMLVHLVVCGLFKAYDPPSKEAIAAMLAKAQAAASGKTPVPNPVAPVTTDPAAPDPNPPPTQPQTSDTGATSKTDAASKTGDTDAASKTGDTDAASKTGDTESQPPKIPAEPNGKNGNTDNSASDKPTTPPKPNPPQPNS